MINTLIKKAPLKKRANLIIDKKEGNLSNYYIF